MQKKISCFFVQRDYSTLQLIIHNKFGPKFLIWSLTNHFDLLLFYSTRKNFDLLEKVASEKISAPPPCKWKHSLPLPFLSFWILTQRSYLTHHPHCTFTLELKDIWPILSCMALPLTVSEKGLTKITFDNFPLFTRPRSSFLSFLHSFTGRCLNESSTDGALSALSSLRLVAIFSYFRITSRLRMFTFFKNLLWQFLWVDFLCSACFVGWSLMKVGVQAGLGQ